MITVSELYVFPVKSLKGIRLQQATLTSMGLQWDRHWMIINPDHRFITQRKYPQLVLIKTQLTQTSLILSKTGMPDLVIPLEKTTSTPAFNAVVWKDTCRVEDEGKAASEWLTQAANTNQTLRLVRMASQHYRPQSKPEKLGRHTTTHFADAAPYLITNNASLKAINQSMINQQLAPVVMEHFRTNIVLDGLHAFEEHTIKDIVGPHYQLQQCYPCQRCIVPTIDINTGTFNPKQQPFSIIAALNSMPDNPKAPVLGENAILARGNGQTISVGDRITTHTV